jgi:polar amino acid transport system substrate-binding protein
MRPRRWLGALFGGLLLVGGLVWLLWPGRELLPNLLPSLLRRDLTWQSMQARGVWKVGMDPSFPPFETLNAAGQPVGFDVDLARALAAEWEMEVELAPIGFDSLLDALQAGKIDAIVSAYPYDPRLTRDVAFSQPYFDAGLQLAAPLDSVLGGRDDLNGRRVAVEWGSEGDMVGRQWQRDGLDVTLVPYETPQDAVAALIEGKEVDALLVDRVTLRQAQTGGAALKAVGETVTSNPYVIVVPRQAHELLDNVNTGLNRLREVSQLAALEQAWFGPSQ